MLDLAFLRFDRRIHEVEGFWIAVGSIEFEADCIARVERRVQAGKGNGGEIFKAERAYRLPLNCRAARLGRYGT